MYCAMYPSHPDKIDYVLSLFTVLVLMTSAGCLTDGTDNTDELHCDIQELMTCGNNKGLYSWEFCRPRTQYTQKILSVHLDLRFPNRYCRSYGTPENFGLTEPGDSMWVINSCFGTFLLCLELETPSTTWVHVPTLVESNVQDDVNQAGPDLVQAPNDKHGVYMATVTMTTSNVTNGEQLRWSENNSAKSKTVEKIEIVNVNENEGLDFTTKVIIIAAIATAGLCIMCLVATIGCAMMKRRDGFEIKDNHRIEIEAESTTVTSLPVSEYQDPEGIYNVIPFDEEGSVFENEHFTFNTVPVEPTDMPQKDPDPHIYHTFSRHQNDSQVSTMDYENEYDRLRNKPKVSVSDNSTYNRISDVCRYEEQNNIYDVCKIPN